MPIYLLRRRRFIYLGFVFNTMLRRGCRAAFVCRFTMLRRGCRAALVCRVCFTPWAPVVLV